MSEHADADGIVSRAKDEVAKAMEKAMTNQGKDADYEEVVEYIDPIQDPYGKAIKYLEQHNILQLFQVSFIFTFHPPCTIYILCPPPPPPLPPPPQSINNQIRK
ncbi:hypothetical protein FSP39_014802 [Pinctada imbricata]|uniref:Uncharacterized protein n=1 Tax=Pinctada imbricata TaxID=66713 RepID=A0AA88XWZ8_PINIB|nr:hypothetical protein FSP39_014802 [Pinctada imbricata]